MALICDPAVVTIDAPGRLAWPKVTLLLAPVMNWPLPLTVIGEADSTSEPTLMTELPPITNPPGV